ncbi:MAG: DUF4157 domain-containing protein [Algicola sp.]|nr:DUF4157 domain-containing protein [Algicola sp.]
MWHTRQYLMLQGPATATNRHWPSTSSAKNNAYTSALPICLKRGMEAVSGVNLQRVRVHYNSALPAEVDAFAYAQGENIYIAPGQEHHLPHELGHVVQQTLGMVQPTAIVNGLEINDDPGLEQHATDLGEKALLQGCG